MSTEDLKYHDCDPDDSWPEYDAQGIYLCRVCDKCRDAKLSRYRPEILTGYNQSDVDEPIEPEDGSDWEGRDELMGFCDRSPLDDYDPSKGY